MRSILLSICTSLSLSLSGQAIAIQEVLYNQSLGNDKFELVNTSAGTINVSNWWLCSRFNYRRLGSASDIEVIQGSLNMAPGAHTKFRIITYDLNNTLSDFGIYIDTNFPSTASMEDFIQYGGSTDVGRGTVAVAKGIWRDMDPGPAFVLDFIPLAGAGQSANFDGSNGGGGELTFATDFTNGSPTLPVSILTLSGRVNINKEVDLNWISLDEVNSNKHIIEKSTDGENYTAIGEVASLNLGSEPAYYHFTDKFPVKNALNYYRIREIDFDGGAILSSVLYVKVKDVPNNKMFISPMPVVNNACFSMELYWPREVDLAEFRIVDMSGRTVKSFFEPLNEGYNIVMQMVTDVDPGSYVLILSDNADNLVSQNFIIGK